MSSRVYTRRFAGPVNLNALGTTSLFVVPVNHVYVIRCVAAVATTTGVANTIRLAIGPSVSPAFRILNVVLQPDQSVYLDVRIPLVAGEELSFSMSVAQITTITIAGYDFLV